MRVAAGGHTWNRGALAQCRLANPPCDCYDSRVANRIPGSFFLRYLVERRRLISQLVKRDFQQRYVGSAAGWVWGLIHPLVLLASCWFIFSICLKAQLDPGEVTQNYPMFLFAGMLPWLLFSETVQRSSGSLVEQTIPPKW